MRVGGGIYTKAADVGADLVGKVEKDLPEDDPRNAAVVADLVGDNVGDSAGRGSDLFQTFSDDIVTGQLVVYAAIAARQYGPLAIFFPLLQQSIGLVSSLIGVFSLRLMKKLKPEPAFNAGMLITTAIAISGSFLLAKFLLNDLRIFVASTLGVIVTLVAAYITRYYVGINGRPVKQIAEASQRGAALNLITRLASGLQSPLASIVTIVIAVVAAYIISGGSLLAIVAGDIRRRECIS